MSRPLLLDLFCGAGGAAMGYHRAGFDVIGVDINPQPRYPFGFIQSSFADFASGGVARWIVAIDASPPCQRYSRATKNPEKWPDLIGPVREFCESTGLPYVIENVEGAPLRDPTMLCGTMFPGLRVLRHRLFESNVELTAPPHKPHPLVHTHDKRKRHYGKTDEWRDFVQVTGGGNCTLAAARDAMGIDWMNKHEINEAIPPAYTEWIGRQLMEHIR